MLPKISSRQRFQPATQNSQVKSAQHLFKPGEIIKGVVIRKLPGNEVIISGKGRQFLAYTDLNLKEGSSHHFQVRHIGSGTVLKVLGGLIEKLESPIKIWASNRIARLNLEGILTKFAEAHNLPDVSDASRRSLTELKNFFPAIIFNDKIKDPSVWLSRFLNGNGTFWENKIARFFQNGAGGQFEKLMVSDLKGILMNIMKNLGKEDHNQDQVKTMISDLKQALFLIEQDQFLNLSSIKEGFGWFWFIPGFREGGFNSAELFVKEDREKDNLAVSLFMEFTMLGKMQTDISINSPVVNIRIGVEDAQKADLVTDSLPILEKSLQALGMATGTITCDVKEFQGQDCLPFSDGDSSSPAVHIVI